jgi:protein-L-isoaspartate(D-aspartate) O-methyltransferase
MTKEELIRSLRNKGISQKTLDAFSKVKREDFIEKSLEHLAYNDGVISIGHGATISQPYTIAVMLNLLKLEKGQKVLELGCGCGYVSALISVIVGQEGRVYGKEIIPELFDKSKRNLIDYQNVEVYLGDGRRGLKEKAPFDRILISAACEEMPRRVKLQLKDKGIMVAPINQKGSKTYQDIRVIQRNKNKFDKIEEISTFMFVPFV